MKRVAKDASVHEKTVQKVASGTVRKPAKKRNQATGSVSSAVLHIKVRPDVWAKALELCGGNPRRIQVIAADQVLIHNKPRRATA